MNRPERITRRQLLKLVLGGAAVVTAVCWIPLRVASRLAKRSRRRSAAVEIPTRPFDERQLYRPHDLAG